MLPVCQPQKRNGAGVIRAVLVNPERYLRADQ